MDVPDLRPLSFGQLLDRTFSYYRKHFWLFVGIMAIPQVLIVAANILIQILQTFAWKASSPSRPPGGVPSLAAGTLVGIVVLFCAYVMFYALTLGATTYAVSEIHLGRTSSIRDAYKSMRGRLWRMIDVAVTVFLRVCGAAALAAFVVFFALGVVAAAIGGASGGTTGGSSGALLGVIAVAVAFLGIVGAVIFGVWLGLRYGVAVPALVLENLKASDALKRSVALTKGNRGRVFLVGLLMTFVSWTVAMLLQGPFLVAMVVKGMKTQAPAPLWLSVPAAVAGGIGHALAGPLLMLGLALLYYDIRVRKEGFDLQVMMSALDAQAPQAAVPPLAPNEMPAQLPTTSALLVFLFSLVSFGLYVPFWYLRRKNALNTLRSGEKLGSAAPSVAFVLLVAIFALSFLEGALLGSGRPLDPTVLTLVIRGLQVAAGIILVLQAFKVRRILEDHLAVSNTGLFAQSLAMLQGSSLSGVATFFFGIIYLQYKINEFAQVWSQPSPTAAQDAVPAA